MAREPQAAGGVGLTRLPTGAITWTARSKPWQVGISTDMIARTLTPKLQEKLGGSFIVDNKAGAGGTVGAGQAKRAAPDKVPDLSKQDVEQIWAAVGDLAADAIPNK